MHVRAFALVLGLAASAQAVSVTVSFPGFQRIASGTARSVPRRGPCRRSRATVAAAEKRFDSWVTAGPSILADPAEE